MRPAFVRHTAAPTEAIGVHSDLCSQPERTSSPVISMTSSKDDNQPRAMPGLMFTGKPGDRSVTGSDRRSITAEAVVDAQGDHVDVLGDPVVEYARKARIDRGEGVVRIPHP